MNDDLTRRAFVATAVTSGFALAAGPVAAQTVITTDGKTYTGIVGAGAAGETVILQADGKKIALLNEQIEETQPSKVSAMPEGLLNELSLEEISDLFTYLGVLQPTPIADKDKETKIR